jgi:hypothetical protein
MRKAKTDELEQVQIVELTRAKIVYHIVGETPLLMNSMSVKAQRELLLPRGRKTAAEKQGSLKHDPLQEFRDSIYRARKGSETVLALLNTQFKAALCTAALDVPGAKKAQIGRLTSIEGGEKLALYGVPQIMCSVVRSADINKTPDIRTRCIVPRWACKVEVTYTTPVLNATVISSLFATAGYTMGVGDWRPQKGSGTFGRWKIVEANDKEYLDIIKTGGADAQQAALDDPDSYDDETDELLSWYDVEVRRRGIKVA